ncbi:bifunctional demethylmenaquinone methyltransferase/2-methoxy-6-polyprenyl-1,4-benzoquinol methylase UbiE [Candidatus Venteria ishoeyi]|uniref:bifunctional demethylmenaquinone methyltransferase/2-methoxy-6-polyprenyl-1,4-benzoquinol methylase UbiE n=1 Tax=Candidatus Venteria ishoeyi TaxID=1899563 RepID=UPI00387E98BC
MNQASPASSEAATDTPPIVDKGADKAADTVADTEKTTHFGFEQVPEAEKVQRVRQVFDSVASNYDLMNDLMSLGIHRLWKRFTIDLAGVHPGWKILDLAGGTGDLAAAFAPLVAPEGEVILSDINAAMLQEGRNRLINKGLTQGLNYVQANAEALPFASNHFNLVTMAFGLRNVTNKQAALESIFRVLKPGGRLLVLEFSEVKLPVLKQMYDLYSFQILPRLGEMVAKDAESYRYLAESIRMHPNQETLKQMMEQAGFERCSYHNLTGGVVALHSGYKF